MASKNKQLITNENILYSLEGQFVLGEKKNFTVKFVEQFLCLLERAEGNLLLLFVDVEPLGVNNAKECAQILSNKLKRGQKVHCMDFCRTINRRNSCPMQIYICIENYFKFTIICIYFIKPEYTF